MAKKKTKKKKATEKKATKKKPAKKKQTAAKKDKEPLASSNPIRESLARLRGRLV